MKVKCDNCGKIVEQRPASIKKRRNHFCSRECAIEWRRRNSTEVEIKCDYCGEITEKKLSEVKGSTHHFCSRICHQNWQRNHRKEHPTYASVEVVCEYCGKTFLRQQGQIKRYKRHFCSMKCTRLAAINRIKTTCANCGKEIEVHPSKLKANKNVFCSRECADPFNGKVQRGENHPNWQGGLTNQKYCYKFDNTLKEKVREKYGRQCFLCGKSEKDNGRKLSVHHVDFDKARGCNGKKWLLVPLCSCCHGKSEHNRDYWEGVIRAKMRKRKLSHTQTILDVYF
jgi:endogenous inhibitor of DNA gyrase (YacG/DUF329 family)